MRARAVWGIRAGGMGVVRGGIRGGIWGGTGRYGVVRRTVPAGRYGWGIYCRYRAVWGGFWLSRRGAASCIINEHLAGKKTPKFHQTQLLKRGGF